MKGPTEIQLWCSGKTEGHDAGLWEVGRALAPRIGETLQACDWCLIGDIQMFSRLLSFAASRAPLFLSEPPPPSPSPLSFSLLVAINYTDSLTGWNKEIKHLNIVSWCMHSSLLPNTDIEEILHSSCQLTKLHERASTASFCLSTAAWTETSRSAFDGCLLPDPILPSFSSL